jgi:hypothetical protein
MSRGVNGSVDSLDNAGWRVKKDDLWDALTDKHPALLSGNPAMTAKGIKQFFDWAYDRGHKHGVAAAMRGRRSKPIASRTY